MPVRYALVAFVLGVFLALIGLGPFGALATIIVLFTLKSLSDFAKLSEKLRDRD